MSVINNFLISFFYKKIGEDNFYNRYYESRDTDYLGRKKRFIIKKNNKETIVPPMWHAWLHHLINEIPNNITDNNFFRQNKNLSVKEIIITKYSKWKP